MIFDGTLGTEIFLQDHFSRQLLILLEQKLKTNDVAGVDEFESFLENLEHWFVDYLRSVNREKK